MRIGHRELAGWLGLVVVVANGNLLVIVAKQPKLPRNSSFPTMESYVCPDNFAVVTHSVYRSSFPKPENFSYIQKLGLKSILWVT